MMAAQITRKVIKVINGFRKDIRLIQNKNNMGLPYSLNLGIKSSKSKYFVRLDSDDYVNKNFLLFLLEFIERNKETRYSMIKKAVSCDYLVVDDSEKNLKKRKLYEKTNCLWNNFPNISFNKLGAL